MTARLFLPFIFLFCSLTFAGTISSSDATNHVGQKKTICGFVAGTKYAVKSHGAPTFLDMDKAYPNQPLTIVIWGSDQKG